MERIETMKGLLDEAQTTGTIPADAEKFLAEEFAREGDYEAMAEKYEKKEVAALKEEPKPAAVAEEQEESSEDEEMSERHTGIDLR